MTTTAAASTPRAWPAEKIEARTVAELMAYPRNPMTHPESQIAQIANSIQKWGWTVPVLIDETNMIIAGHGRVMAAKRLGLGTVPVMVAHGWSDAEKRAYVIADNQLTRNSEWNPEILQGELTDLQAVDFDLDVMGFPEASVVSFLSGLGDLPGVGTPAAAAKPKNLGALAAKFGIPPFSVLNAREGWWQDRKAAWIALGIQSELGRGAGADGPNATPAGAPMPAADYSKSKARGDGRRKAMSNGKKKG